jgi:cytochrome c
LEITGAWTPENISSFIESPRAYAPGTKMAYNGMRDVEDRADLIAYLATLQ